MLYPLSYAPKQGTQVYSPIFLEAGVSPLRERPQPCVRMVNGRILAIASGMLELGYPWWG